MNWLIGQGRLTVPVDGAVLHVAPNEASLVRRFSVAADYVPADLHPEIYPVPGMQRIDLMEMADEDRYDLFYASHVMEHVPDDGVVLRNIYRALKPGGEAWLIVPLWDKPTEDGSFAMSPRERERRFGQWDHVRQYGPDFADRIRAAGFDLEEIDASSIDGAVRQFHALDDRLFRARKPVGAARE
jgi:SAM-dependent methyltransferase